ncbi:MAG: hypothetical protein ACOH1Y_14760 [Propionicimonas sp.]
MSPRHIRAAMAAVVTAAMVTTVSPAASAVEPQLPDVQIISPAWDDPGPLNGPFTLKVSLDLHGSASVDLSPSMSYGVNYVAVAGRTVTAAQCLSLCTISFEVDPTTWESPLPSSWAFLAVSWSSSQGSSGTSRGLRYVAPVESVWISAFERDDTAAVRGYHRAVMDTGGSLVISASPGERTPGEVLEARVYPGPNYGPLPVPVLAGTGSWDLGGAQPAVGRIRLETANLAAGTYRLLVRARNPAGRYGFGTESFLTVRHRPVVEVDLLPQFLLAGTKLVLGASVSRPLPDGVTPGSFQVSVDGGPALILPVQSWTTRADISVAVRGHAVLPAASLPAGDRMVAVQVLDTLGRPLGSPATGQVRAVTFTEQASVTTLVVGQPSTITFAGMAPAGMSYDSCTFMLFERAPMGGGGLCSRGDTSYTRSIPWSPQTAGPGRVEFSVRTVQGVDSALRTVPVTVYAARTATLSATSSSAYGTRAVATIIVRDMTNLSSPLVAANGAAVVVQRRMAGTSTWLNVGSGRTDATGRALVPFTNTASGRLRAVVASSVPAKSVTTAERAVTSVSTVSWSSLPTSTRSGALAYASVVARPYEGGASVRVQARFSGGSWRTVGSASMSSTGVARPGFRLYARGTWEVRVMRVGTTLRANGYSSVRRLSVK